MYERDKRGGKVGDQDKRLAADLVFTKALVEACERLFELYRPRLDELQHEVGNGKRGQDKKSKVA